MNAPLLRIADNRVAEDNVVTYFTSEVYYVLTDVRVESLFFYETMRAREVTRGSWMYELWMSRWWMFTEQVKSSLSMYIPLGNSPWLIFIYSFYPVLTASSNIHHLIQEKRNFQSGSFGVSICLSENGWITRILVVFLVVSFFTELRPNVKKISVCT